MLKHQRRQQCKRYGILIDENWLFSVFFLCYIDRKHTLLIMQYLFNMLRIILKIFAFSSSKSAMSNKDKIMVSNMLGISINLKYEMFLLYKHDKCTPVNCNSIKQLLFSYTDGKTIILYYWVVRVSKNIERVLRLQSFETTYICMPHVNSTS